ncbi:MAG TPA: 16S rRNA (guanine(527)-N(7))-methyltransferase RsmG [Erysipelotrichaceae bacterium]|nr:16S rRNA (guanine(527)-N(7))-methyltransferase RsmG [Erysipelotrichaceae bacterium]HQB31924.1 16S rRNA (guanine(527)-N(7))-methyltransferase RsmG [Erysipelotrichaceae bacterium]
MDYNRFFLEHQIELDENQLYQLERYADLLIEWNKKFNLTAITDKDDIYVKHFLDCLLLGKMFNPANNLIDVGTGAGFPGLVLKIYNPRLEVFLLEPNNKKVSFLKEAVAALKLDGVYISNQRAEVFAKEHFEKFNFVTARAVAPLNILAELCLPLLKVDGHFLAMKGPKGYQELKQAEKALATLGAQLHQISEFGLTEDSQRLIIDLKKINHTPAKYPRNYGQIKKRPL